MNYNLKIFRLLMTLSQVIVLQKWELIANVLVHSCLQISHHHYKGQLGFWVKLSLANIILFMIKNRDGFARAK
ncbi:unnamed protein product (macronuclear) [Paramecium tetraurelia]|uniref:Uncharacterized protein n=1 Tax=Paramecium tetraurelia TaxID=5888 RepID=A0BUI7_PARTE|nr:uncharacterized protein GSPATT00032436001 [Paramecium tetraurelia]CAK62204.1 unnamed protein product [Paramecium tetraurelia]|eukprot:XP_001429602.1 hypothetical protein (macronuclear) [Paramecium tetraurelia strain d4-2]